MRVPRRRPMQRSCAVEVPGVDVMAGFEKLVDLENRVIQCGFMQRTHADAGMHV